MNGFDKVHRLYRRCYMDGRKMDDLRVVADVFCLLRIYQCYEDLQSELHKGEVPLITGTLLVMKAKNKYRNTTNNNSQNI